MFFFSFSNCRRPEVSAVRGNSRKRIATFFLRSSDPSFYLRMTVTGAAARDRHILRLEEGSIFFASLARD